MRRWRESILLTCESQHDRTHSSSKCPRHFDGEVLCGENQIMCSTLGSLEVQIARGAKVGTVVQWLLSHSCALSNRVTRFRYRLISA